ncbi:MAG: hypothetical protein ACI4JC_00990 [Faecalibacterium sp.]
MRAESNIKPSGKFKIEALAPHNGAACTVIFYDNITEQERKDQNGEPELVYSYDTYRLEATFSSNLEHRISTNLAAWMQAAKDAESVIPEPTPEQRIKELQQTVDALEKENASLNSVVEQLVIDSLAGMA